MQEERQPMGSESLGTLLRSWRDGTFSERCTRPRKF